MGTEPTLDVPPDLWETITNDAEVIADEYRDEGWTVLTLFPGKVVPLPNGGGGTPAAFGEEESSRESPERFGLDVLVPDNQFDELESHVEDGSFESFEVHRGEAGGNVLLVLVVTDESTRRAVVCPLYFQQMAAGEMRAAAEANGTMHTYVHTLDGSRELAFTHDRPELFFEA